MCSAISRCFLQLFAIAVASAASGQEETLWAADRDASFAFNPTEIEGLIENHVASAEFNVTQWTPLQGGTKPDARHVSPVCMRLESADSEIVTIEGKNNFVIIPNDGGFHIHPALVFTDNATNLKHCVVQDAGSNSSTNDTGLFHVKGHFLGRTEITFSRLSQDPVNRTTYDQENLVEKSDTKNVISDVENHSDFTAPESNQWTDVNETYRVAVIREERVVDIIFLASVTILVVLGNTGMGCKVELDVVKKVLKRPLAPCIGFCCQYIIMPLVS